MSEWINCTLGDIAEVIGGGTPSKSKPEYYEGGTIPWITPKDLSGYPYRYIERGENNITELGLAKSSARMLPKGAVLFSSRAPIGYVAIAKNPLCTNQGFKSFICDEKKVNNLFLYYFLKSNLPMIENMANGSTFKEISGSVAKTIPISLPPLNIQEKIVSIIGSLDDKIELNLKMNETLEEMAMTLYKHWFIDFGPFQDGEFVESELGMIPKGWDVVQLSNVVNTQYGYTQSASEEKIGPHFLRITDIQENFISWNRVPYCSINEKDYEKYKLKKGDIVIARTGNSTGAVGYINSDVEAVFASFLVRLQPKNEQVSPHYLYLLTTSEGYQTYLNNVANGSARKGANAKVMTEYKIALPPKEVMYEFHNKVDGLLELIEQNIRENIELEQIRDYLLPRLLSGEIDLSQAEKQVEEVL
ncbi:hypothetical protein ETC01_16920 [Geobacillus sp. NFOSA3]|nr:hypothetical protein [Geobacillus sp. NFOSA3]